MHKFKIGDMIIVKRSEYNNGKIGMVVNLWHNGDGYGVDFEYDFGEIMGLYEYKLDFYEKSKNIKIIKPYPIVAFLERRQLWSTTR